MHQKCLRLVVLLRLGGHFHPARLTEISAPDIYGIIVDKERGSKPHIFSRQEIIRDAVSLFNLWWLTQGYQFSPSLATNTLVTLGLKSNSQQHHHIVLQRVPMTKQSKCCLFFFY